MSNQPVNEPTVTAATPQQPIAQPASELDTTQRTTSVTDWQRSSAWSVVPYFFATISQFIGLIIGGTYFSFKRDFAQYSGYIIVTVTLLIIAKTIARWWFTEFRVSTAGVELRHGIFSKHHLQLPKSRIQELQIRQPFYFRPLQLFAVSLDSAGSKQQEFQLTGLTAAQLQLLQGQDCSTQQGQSTPFWRLWLATLYNKHLWLPLAAVLGASHSYFDGKTFNWLWQQLTQGVQWLDLSHSSHSQQILMIIASILVIAAVLALLTMVWLYPQQLLRQPQQLTLMHGSVVKTQKRIWQRRVQMVTVNQPWLAWCFGHFSLIFHGFGNNDKGQKAKLIALGQVQAEVDEQLHQQQWLSLTALQQQPHQRFMPAYFQRLTRWLALAMLVATAVVLFLLEKHHTWQALAVTVLALWWCADYWAFKRWHGYVVVDDVLYFWRGGIGQYWQVLPLRQVQKVALRQSRYFSRQQMVRVKLLTANGNVTLNAIPNQQAQQLYQQVLQQTQN